MYDLKFYTDDYIDIRLGQEGEEFNGCIYVSLNKDLVQELIDLRSRVAELEDIFYRSKDDSE